ncbi:MAG: hypothetical protein V3T81_05820 [Thermoanaerobaculia bacterium]
MHPDLWSLTLPGLGEMPASLPPSAVLEVYPTQLFEAGMAFLIFAYLWTRRETPHGDGWLFGLGACLVYRKRAGARRRAERTEAIA